MNGILDQHLQKELPVVIYRYPGRSYVTALLQKDKKLRHPQDLETAGFVIAPFDKAGEKFTIQGDRTLVFEDDELGPAGTFKGALEAWNIPENSGYKEMVAGAIQTIQSTELEKVVLSTAIEHPSTTSPLVLYRRLLALYPNAFCYLWHHPLKGIWLGASPEVLLKETDKEVMIMSLAGTRAVPPDGAAEWTAKEDEEQQLVTNYIESVARQYLTNIRILPREETRAGNLLHLKTIIKGRRKNGIGKLIESLHPTPAVAGVPMNKALEFIQLNENYHREFYTGYLGEINMGEEGKTELYVNLRCMQWFPDKVLIYVGGGITYNSNPSDEWEELLAKSRTIAATLDI